MDGVLVARGGGGPNVQVVVRCFVNDGGHLHSTGSYLHPRDVLGLVGRMHLDILDQL